MIRDGIDGLDGSAFDICVVGSGPAGITLGLELSRLGIKVLLLESGDRKPTRKNSDLSRGSVVDRRVHDDIEITVSRQLGGTSNLWGARCQPLDPIDFAQRAELVGANWPIEYSDVAPFYERACEYASCGAPVFRAPHNDIDPADPSVDGTRLERFSTQPAFQKAHAASLESSENLTICLNSTVTDVAYRNGAVASVTVQSHDAEPATLPVRQLVLAAGGLETARLLLNLQKRSPDLFGGEGGPLGRYYMAHVVGEVADVIWSKKSLDAAYDFSIDEHGSYMRRRMIPGDAAIIEKSLPNVSFWPVVPRVADARHGSAVLSSVFLAFAIKPIGRLLVAETIRRYHAPAGVPVLPHILNVLRNWPKAMIFAPRFLYQRYFAKYSIPGFFVRNPAMTYGLSFHAEHFPAEDSRVWLNDDTDAFGMQRLTVDLKFSRKDAEALKRAHEHLDAWLKNNGLGQLRYRQPESETVDAILAVATHGTHQIGTARMGSDRSTAVVDQNLESFDIRGLYLLGSAVFPTSGQANPTLTIVALALRLAEHLTKVAR